MTWTRRLLHQLDSAWFAVDMGARMARERVERGILYNPTRAELRVDPHSFYRELRERDPFHRSYPADGWVLSRHADCLEVLSDRSFSSDERNLARWKRLRRRGRLAGIPDPYDEDLASMLRLDPPDHTRLRNLVSKAFTPRAVERMRDRIRKLLDELLPPLQGAAGFELMDAVAGPLPVIVIAEMLGVPSSDRDRFRHWSDEVVRLLGDSSFEDVRRAFAARVELSEYFAEICDERRRAPKDDLVSALVAAEEAGDRLSQKELFSTLVLLLVAGNETTTKLIGNGMLALLRHPEQLERLRKEPELIPNAVEEMLRFDGPVQVTSRIVLEDRELRGHRLRKGQQLVLLLAGANRDPAAFDDPERFDVTRESPRHLAFGQGAHFCLGAQLARLEAALAFEALIERFPDLELGADPVAWGENMVLRGPTRVPLETKARKAA